MKRTRRFCKGIAVKKSNRDVFDCTVIGTILFVLVFIFGVSTLNAQTEGQIIRGTVNVVLANSNGMVILTDSTGTITDSAGRHIGTQESQKLIRLDEYSVCAIAGFGSATIPASLPFNANVIGILSDFRDQLAAKNGQLTFDYKLRSLSFLLELFIQGFANIKEVLQPGELKHEQLTFTLFLVGYDSDGKSKIGSLELDATPETLSNGKISWRFGQKIKVEDVGDRLNYRIGGMWDVGAKIMTSPQGYSDSPVVQKFIDSAANHGAALQVTDLEGLAKFVSSETSKKYPDAVGGLDQIAIFQGGHLVRFEQQPFPPAPKQMPFTLIMDVTLHFGPGGAIVGPKGSNTIWIRNTLVGYQNLVIDGNFFLGNEIRDSLVVYNGAPAVFDSSNKIVNSRLRIMPVGPNAEFARYLMRGFPWSQCIPIPCGAIN
jgi:hypothetical protein